MYLPAQNGDRTENEQAAQPSIVAVQTTIETARWRMINGCSEGSKHCSGKSAYHGCDGHYNSKGHAILAAAILPQLRKIMGW